MRGCPNKAMDTHTYMAWEYDQEASFYHNKACGLDGILHDMETFLDMPMITGEWSLATDSCCMWLNGVNDNQPGYPKSACEMVTCPDGYTGDAKHKAPDPSLPYQGPRGQGQSGPEFGKCPAYKKWEDEDAFVGGLAKRLINSWNKAHGCARCYILFGCCARPATCLRCASSSCSLASLAQVLFLELPNRV